MSHFGDLIKRDRYEQLSADLADVFSIHWNWQRFRQLLKELGVDDPYGFLAAGWWLPVDARLDRTLVDRYAAEAEQAMAEGQLPKPGTAAYQWDDVYKLMDRCHIEPVQAVKGLLWEYAYTPGESIFIEAVRQVAKTAAP